MNSTCVNHADRASAFACDRCLRFFCGDCVTMRIIDSVSTTYCIECKTVLDGYKATSNAVLALVLAILSLQCVCFPLAIPALLLGYSELQKNPESEATKKTRSMAKGAVIVGWMGLALSLIVVLIGVAAVVLGGTTLNDFH